MSCKVGRQAIFSKPENVEEIREVLFRSPRKLIRRAVREIVIKYESLRKVIVNDLKLFLYKMQMHHRLSAAAIE